MCGFDGVQRGNYFGEELIRRTELVVRVGKATGKDKFTREMVRIGGDMGVD